MASRRGVWLFVALLIGVGSIVLVAALQLRPSSAAAGSVLVLDVPPQLDEIEQPFRPFRFGLPRRAHGTVFDLVRAIRYAAEDEHVTGLVLHIDDLDWGWARLLEVRDAIQVFRAAGKPVYASLTGGGEAEYLLASAADTIASPPTTVLQLDGLQLSAMFFRGTFDKLDVRPNFAHVGAYKSGTEPYTRTGMSGEMREALDTLLGDTYSVLVDSLARARGTTPEAIRQILDDGPFVTPEARARGLIDTVLYVADLDSLATRTGHHRYGTTSFTRYADRIAYPRLGPHIALVSAAGEITSGRSRFVAGQGYVLGAETVIDALDRVRSRRSIRAVVLRIDSPGGAFGPSDDIWKAVMRCREVKPVIVSMSDLAASGGYYFAAAADRIVAQSATITGSIGIFGGKLNVLGLYRKLGMNVESVTRGRHASMFSPFSDFSDEEAARYSDHLQKGYDLFLDRVVRGRHMSRTLADSVARGRVWSGARARQLGLVDELGGMDRAFQLALEKIGSPRTGPYVVERWPRSEKRLFERLLEQAFEEEDDDAQAALPEWLDAALVAGRFPAGVVMALLPVTISIR